MRVRSSSSRTLGPWLQGPVNACHTDTLELSVLTRGALAVRLGEQEGWHRAYEVSVVPPGVLHSCWTEAEGASRVPTLLERYRARRIVVGHTPSSTHRIIPRFDDRIFLIDTGMVFQGGRASALEIVGETVTQNYVE